MVMRNKIDFLIVALRLDEVVKESVHCQYFKSIHLKCTLKDKCDPLLLDR